MDVAFLIILVNPHAAKLDTVLSQESESQLVA